MSNEELVKEIQDEFSVTENMERLYYDNLPLLKELVRPYTYYAEKEDLLQQAYLGLWQAVHRYEPSINVKFMSFASYWIRREVVRYLEQNGSCIRIPSYLKGEIRRYKKYVDDYTAIYQKEPDIEVIRRDLGLSERQMTDIRIYMQDIKSIDEPFRGRADGEAYYLSDLLSENSDIENDIVEREYNRSLHRDLWYAVDNYLPSEEKKVIRLSFIGNNTLDAIGQRLGISSSCVKRLKVAGLKNLRWGKARFLLEKYAETDKFLYTGCSFESFKTYGSNVETIAVRRASIEERIRKDNKGER